MYMCRAWRDSTEMGGGPGRDFLSDVLVHTLFDFLCFLDVLRVRKQRKLINNSYTQKFAIKNIN